MSTYAHFSRFLRRKVFVSFAILLIGFSSGPAAALDFYWDADATSAGNNLDGTGLGGAGTWDTSLLNWWDLAGDVAWPNNNLSNAIFTSSFPTLPYAVPVATAVNVDAGGVTANRLTFIRSGYTVSGGALTLAGTGAGLQANLGESATIDSQISGTAGLVKSGGGSIRLGNALNDYTGTTTIADGSLIISNPAALGGTGAVSILTTNTTPLNTSLIGFGGGSLVLDGTAGAMTFARDVNFEGRGPVGDRGSAILSLGSNTLSGILSSAVSPLPLSPTASFRNSRINSVNGTLTLSGTLNAGGTSATTFVSLGGVNSAGIGDFNLTGVLAGTGSIEKSGAGTLFLNPSSTSGFTGTVRVGGSATGQQSSVRVTQLTVGGTSIFGANTAGNASGAIDLNGGVLEFRNDGNLDFNALSSGKNVYLRATGTLYTGPAAGGAAINGLTTLGTFRVAANQTQTFNSRNGYGMTLQAWTQESSNANTGIANAMGGTLTFTGDAWNNADGSARNLTFSGNGNTRIIGNITATGTTKQVIKQGTGELILNGTGGTFTGNTSIEGGAVRITDFRSINNVGTASISLGNATTTGGNLIIGGTGVGTGTAAGLTSAKPIILNTTSGSNSIYANQAGANPVILNGAITKIAAATTGALILGGSNTLDNIINVAIPVETTPSTGGVTKLGSGTWVLNAANTYLGATTIQGGTLKLRATGTASDVIKESATNTVVFSSQAVTGAAGGTLEFRGVATGATTETLGALTPTAGASTVRLLGQGGFAANLVFNNATAALGATAAATSLNFDTTGANGGTISFTGVAPAAATATTLPGTANFQGHLYLNGSNFADIVAGVVSAPTYGGAGNFRDAGAALVAATHNRLTGATTMAAGTTISSLLTNSQTLTMSGNLVVSTGGILQSGGTASILSNSATARLIQGGAAGTNVAIRVNGASDVLNLGNATNPVNISSVTTAGLTKNGAGTLVVFGTNAQTGTTTINEGKVSLDGAAARLSATTASLVVRQDATLELLSGVTAANAVVNALDGAGTISGLSGQTFTQNGGGTWNGVFSGAGLNITKGGAAATWSGVSSYTGVTTIGGTGLVTVDTLANGGVNSGIGASSNAASNLVFTGSTAGIDYRGSIIDNALTLGSRSASTDRLFTLAAAATGANLTSSASNNNAIIWSNTGAIVNNTSANAVLTFAGASAGDNTFNPQIVDSSVGGITLGVTKSGAGQWNLGASNNTYTGVTTLNEGILGLNNNGALSGNSPLLLAPTSATSAAILQVSGTFERNLAATATAGSGTVTFGGAIASTTGGVGFAAHSTPLTVAIGGVGSPTALTWGAGGFIGTGAVQNLVLNSTTALSSVDFKNAIDLGAAARTINVLDNVNTGADYATMSGALSGTGGSVVKAGGGILRLTGANSYTGTTAVEAGTLVVSSLGSSTGGATSGVGAGGVAMDNSNAIVLGNATTTGGLLQYVGAGETSDRKIRLRGTTAGNQIHADGSGPLILTNVAHDTTETGSKTLSLRGTNTAGNMITSVLSDNGLGVLSIGVDGGATWILTGANTYTGNTTASGGALGIGNNGALGTVGGLVNSNGNVFAYGADRTLANTVTLANNATNGWFGDYSLTFSNPTNLGASANNVTTNNSIAAGKTLTMNGLTANALTDNRTWTIDGQGETVINGAFTSTTGNGVGITKQGNGTLTLGTNGATSNWNIANNAVDVDRGMLKFTANNAIPTTFTAAPAAPTTAGTPIAGTTITVASTAGLQVGQRFSGTNVPVGSVITAITSSTTFTTSLAPTTAIASGASLTFFGSGGLTLSPEVETLDTSTVDLNGTSQTVTGLTATTTGAVVIDNTSGTPATFTFGANNSAVSITNTGARTITDSGAGALSIVKTGNTALTLPTGMTLTYQGSTSSTGGGSFTINSALNGTTGLIATGNSTLALPGGLTTPGTITSIEVGGGSILSLLDGTGSAISNLTSLNLGAGSGTTTLNLNVGDSLAVGDFLNTDTLTLLTGNSATLANTITFNMTDAGLNPLTTYTLLNLADGGLTAFGTSNIIQGATPGGFSGFTWNVTDNLVQLTTGTLITGNSYWRGLTDTTWNANANNWSTDKAGTTPAASIPGSGTDVVFAYDGIAAAPLATTLEQNIKINSLTFEAGATTPTSVTIAPGAVTTNRLEVAPQVATDGIKITAGGPAAVIISAPLRLGGAVSSQTWNVADAASVLTLSGGLQGEKDVTKTGSGKVTVSIAADSAFNSGNTADFTINGGNLEILSIDALGVVGKRANVAVNTGAAFYYNNAASGTVTNALTLGGGTLSAGGANQTYSGSVNVSTDSIINMRNNNGGTGETQERNITLSGVVSGAGNLTVFSDVTLSSGNALSGTLTLNNAANTWTGDLFINQGSVTFGALASPAITANDITFSSLGKVSFQGVNAATLTRTGTLSYAAGSIGEFNVDNTSGTLGANYLVDQNGAVTLGTGGTGASMRVFLADVASAVDITGGVTLGGNSSISVAGGDADSLLHISSVILDGGSGYSLAINDDAGAWAQTNTIVRLSNLNTFSGNFALGEGIGEFNTVTNAGGAASSLGQGNTISLGGGNLRFIGSASQSTNRPIATTASSTLSAHGTGGATITYTGAITQALDNGLTLLGTDNTAAGFITGGITQVGVAADLSVSSGNWTLSGAPSVLSDDIIVTNASAVLNLTGSSLISFTAGTSNGLYARTGATINLLSSDVFGPLNSGGLDFILLGDNSLGGGTLNTNTFNIETPRLDLGQRTIGFEGQIDGTGTVFTRGGAIDLFRGTVNANLGSDGSTSLEKISTGTVTLKGDNSGMASTGSSLIYEGTLVLDYTASNTTKLRAASALDMRGSNLVLTGNASASSAQTVASFTIGSGGTNAITLNPGSGQSLVLNLNAITRAINAQDGTVRFTLPGGSQSATNGITTDTLNTLGSGANAILGGWATVNDGTGVFFARNLTNAADGNIVAATTTSQDAVGSWLTGENISDSASFTGTLGTAYLNSLRFNAASGSDLVLASGGVLGIASGGLLVTDNVGGTPSLMNGTIFSGAQASNVPELIITQDSAAVFQLGADLRTNSALTKSGSGTLLLSGNNVYSGGTEIQDGVLQVSGGNAIGDTSLVTLATYTNSTLRLLANETIGRLTGGQRQTDSDNGLVDVGSHTLTFNQSAGTTYSGRFTGSGQIVMNTGSTGNFNYNGQTSTSLFTGSVTVNGGLFQLSGDTARLGSAAAFTINGRGSLLLDNNATTNVTDRISDTATFTLNSASGPFSGETIPRGLSIRNDDNDDSNETIGSTTFNSGANYLSLEASGGTSAQSRFISAGWTRLNGATVNVRGRNLGATADAAGRTQFKVTDANDAAMIAANVGGGGTIGGTAKNVSIVPWAIGENLTAGLVDGNMGNTFLTYVDNRGFVPLNLTNEFSTFATFASGDNVRESLSGDLTGVPGATVNSLIVNNAAVAGLDVTGTGVGQTLGITSGAMLFTVTGGVASTAYDTTLGGFDSGITVGGTNEYVIHVVNPSSAANTSTLTVTLASPLTSSADITKSGRGTLILNQVNTAGGGARKTTINEGTLEIADLDHIGGATGSLVFAGGTLRLGSLFDELTDDLSGRSILFREGGGTIDTNGNDPVFAGSLGSGTGGFTKAGLGNLTLNATASYTGATTLSAGTITIGAANALGNGGNLTLSGGTTLALGSNSIRHGLVTTSGASPAITGTGTINTSSGVFLNHTGDTTIDAILAGAGGLLKAQANTVTLTGLSTYTGATEIQAGSLSLNSIGNVGGGASSLGAPANTEDGIIRMGLTTAATALIYTGSGHTSNRLIGMQGTTGGVTIDADGTGALVLGGVRAENAGAKTLTLRGSSASILENSSGQIQEVGAVLSVLKADANTWAYAQSQSYTGTTTVDNGILRLKVAQNLTGALQYGSANTITTTGTVEAKEDAAFGSLLVQPNGSASLVVDPTKEVTINGNVTIGSAAASSVTNFAATGGGDFTVNNLTNTGNTFLVGGTGTANTTLADFSALSTMNVALNTTSGVLLVSSNSGTNATGKAELRLADTSVVSGSAITVGGGGTFNGNVDQVNLLKLGSVSNTLNVNTVNIGTGARDLGSITFLDSSGSVTVRAADGSSAAAFNMGTGAANTSVALAGNQNTFDVTGHNADLKFSTVSIGTQNRNADLVNVFSFDTGTLDIGSLTASTKGANASTTTTTINLGGGTVTTGAWTLATASGAGNAVATANLTGGNVTFSGAINRGADAAGGGTATGTVNLNGATLDMGGNNIGSATNQIVFNAQSGTLQNLGELNGGGNLVKTTAGTLVLAGDNNHTGRTVVNAGILSVSSEDNLGNNPLAFNAAQLEIDGGTLLTTASFTIDDANRGVTVGATGGTIETAASTALTVASTSPIVLTGNLTKTGDGALYINSTTTGSGNVNITDGTFGGTGTISGNTTIGNGAILTGGTDGTAGTINFNGTLTNTTGATWLIDLVGDVSGSSDLINLGTGALDLNNAILSLAVTNFTAGNSYTIATYSSLIGGSTFNGIGQGDIISGYQIDYGSTAITLTAVPEPGTLGLLGVALGGFFFRRLRKRRNAAAVKE
jgi:autotransporter-associated beta strand protein